MLAMTLSIGRLGHSEAQASTSRPRKWEGLSPHRLAARQDPFSRVHLDVTQDVQGVLHHIFLKRVSEMDEG